MSALLAQSDVLPDANTGYVAAAYLILFALVVVYFGIMAVKLSRIEREVAELDELAARQQEARDAAPRSQAAADAAAETIERAELTS